MSTSNGPTQRPVRLELIRTRSGLSNGADGSGYASIVLAPSLASHIRRISAAPDAPRLSAYARTRHWDQSPPPSAHVETIPSPRPTSRSAPVTPTSSISGHSHGKAASEGTRKTPSPLGTGHSSPASSVASAAAMSDIFAPQATASILLSAISRADMPLAPSTPPQPSSIPPNTQVNDKREDPRGNPCRSVSNALQDTGGSSTPLLAS